MLSEQPLDDWSRKDIEETLPESYAFVMNVWHLRDGGMHTLAPGHQLRRATPDEIVVIKETIQRLVAGSHRQSMHLWEQRWPHPGGTIEYLPEAEWRYFVIAFRGSNATITELQAAFDLAPLELELGFTILYSGIGDRKFPGLVWKPGRLFHVLDASEFIESFFVDVSAPDVESIAAIYSQLQQHDHRVIDIKRHATLLSELKALPHKSPLRFLGYFAMLESLLTHPPKPTDPYDSITRQVKKKLALLDHRWPCKIEYSPFGGARPETIWSKMYSYRSLLAHGGVPNFQGELAALKSHELALKLIKETVKAVVRHVLAEPQLLLDLRDC